MGQHLYSLELKIKYHSTLSLSQSFMNCYIKYKCYIIYVQMVLLYTNALWLNKCEKEKYCIDEFLLSL